MPELMKLLEHRDPTHAVVVNVCNVHSVMSARTDQDLARAFADGEISTPDGLPLVWVMKTTGASAQTQVRGTDIVTASLAHGGALNWRHFFYGSTPETLGRLQSEIAATYPDAHIAGAVSPPFREQSDAELDAVAREILDARADLVWVGLGMPRQEKWMHRIRARLPGTVLVGVGAAFDFLAGTKREAPHWMRTAGLEWAFRLGSEPRRLWRRYLWNNPAFLALWLRASVAPRSSQR